MGIVRAGLAVLSMAGVAWLLWWFTWQARNGRRYPLRRIAAFEVMRGFLDVIAERGKRVHVSLGSAGLGGDQTVAISAGLALLRYLTERASLLGSSPTVTVSDPALLYVAQDVVYSAHEGVGRAAQYRATDVQLVAPDPAAYAVGAQDAICDGQVAANVMVGPFGEEFLLMGEAGAQQGIVQVAGSNSLDAQPFILATADHPLIGEEMFAAGAYLTDRPEQAASLWVQDILRVLVVVAIAIGVLVKTIVG